VGGVNDRQVFRSTGAVVAWWGWLAFAAASLVALAAGGRDHSSVVTAVLLVAVTGVMYGCALRPRIVADEHGISVLNPFREHAVPWPAVTRVDLVNAVRVHCAPAPGAARGTVVYSWAVQSSGRARLKSESRARRAARQTAGRPAAYARLPPEARDALERSAAEFIARQLDERAARERQRTGPGPGPSGGSSGSPSSGASGSPPDGTPGSAAATGTVQVTWAWRPIVVMALPVLALIIVVIT
jgi:hypothetical protein